MPLDPLLTDRSPGCRIVSKQIYTWSRYSFKKLYACREDRSKLCFEIIPVLSQAHRADYTEFNAQCKIKLNPSHVLRLLEKTRKKINRTRQVTFGKGKIATSLSSTWSGERDLDLVVAVPWCCSPHLSADFLSSPWMSAEKLGFRTNYIYQTKLQCRKSKTCKEATAASLSLSFCSCSFINWDFGSNTNLALSKERIEGSKDKLLTEFGGSSFTRTHAFPAKRWASHQYMQIYSGSQK